MERPEARDGEELALAIERHRLATDRRERARPGTPEYNEALDAEERLFAVVLQLLRARSGRRASLERGSPDPVSRQPDGQGADDRRRAILRAALIRSGMQAEMADIWITAWAAEASRQGLQPSGLAYWQAAGRWIGKHRPPLPEGEGRTD